MVNPGTESRAVGSSMLDPCENGLARIFAARVYEEADGLARGDVGWEGPRGAG